jgi:hypothetical protein
MMGALRLYLALAVLDRHYCFLPRRKVAAPPRDRAIHDRSHGGLASLKS